MTRVALALGSFIVGACVSSATSLFIHTSTRAQEQQPTLLVAAAEPTVPPLAVRLIGGDIVGALQPLDGMDCEGCTIKASVISYGGGAFNCEKCIIKSKTVTLKGAALNTLNMLRFFGAIPNPPPKQSKPQPPIQTATIEINTQGTADFVSLAGLRK
jgi:hypothetical protein